MTRRPSHQAVQPIAFRNQKYIEKGLAIRSRHSSQASKKYKDQKMPPTSVAFSFIHSDHLVSLIFHPSTRPSIFASIMKLLALALTLASASNVVAMPQKNAEHSPAAVAVESNSVSPNSRAVVTVLVFKDAFFRGNFGSSVFTVGDCCEFFHFNATLLLVHHWEQSNSLAHIINTDTIVPNLDNAISSARTSGPACNWYK